MATTLKGFINDWAGNRILPITRGELVLDQYGNPALTSQDFEAGRDGNAYGLISAADLSLLKGGADGQGISDIYAKLKAINEGFYVNETPYNFYNKTTGAATPIKFNIVEGLTVGIANNTITLGLTPLTTNGLSASQILKGITVDKFGRVTAIDSAALTSEDIPATLVNKTLSGGLTDVEDVADNARAIVNKAYVDKKFTEVTGMATGALKFGGPIPDATIAENALSNSTWLNHYFKVTKEFSLNTGDFYDPTGNIIGSTVTVKVGDTLIVTNLGGSLQFVHVPSGDDITTITVTKESTVNPIFPGRVGDMTLQFSEVFGVTNPSNGNTVKISLPQVNQSTSGYLSFTDYNEFKNYANALKVSYTETLKSGDYQIGTLKIGDNSYVLYGKNNVSALTLTDGTSGVYNPILKFTEAGVDTKITLKGLTGLTVKRTGSSVEFASNIEVHSDSSEYLAVTDGYKVGVKLGSFDSSGGYTQGLVGFNTVHDIITLLKTTTLFENIDYSLSGDASKKFQYGNDNLATAVAVTI